MNVKWYICSLLVNRKCSSLNSFHVILKYLIASVEYGNSTSTANLTFLLTTLPCWDNSCVFDAGIFLIILVLIWETDVILTFTCLYFVKDNYTGYNRALSSVIDNQVIWRRNNQHDQGAQIDFKTVLAGAFISMPAVIE